MTDTETGDVTTFDPAAVEGRLLAWVPAELVTDPGKTRAAVEDTLDAGWVAELRDYIPRSRLWPSAATGDLVQCGNHTPVVLMTMPSGQVKVRTGARRTLGCGRAGTFVLGYVAGPEGEEAAEQLADAAERWSENHSRAGTTTLDDALAVEALFSIKGMTAARAARALRLDKPQVGAYRTLAKSQTARDAAAAGLNLMQSAAIDEFDGDTEAVDRLTRIAQDYPASFDHEIAEMRATRAVRAARDAAVAELEAAGYTIWDEYRVPPRLALANLRHPADGDADPAAITEADHETCPGRAVTIDLDWQWPDDATRDAWIATQPDLAGTDPAEVLVEFDDDSAALEAGMIPVWVADVHLCTDPEGHGHASVYGGTIAPAPGREADPGAAAAARAETQATADAAAKAEARRVREMNTRWRAHTPVRRKHVQGLLARPKLGTAKDPLRIAAGLLRAKAIARHQTSPQMASMGHRVAADLLGLGGSEWDADEKIIEALDAASPDRREVIELAMILGACEHPCSGTDLKDAEIWRATETRRYDSAHDPKRAAGYLRWLRDHTGYDPSEIENGVIHAIYPDDEKSAATATAGGDGDISWRQVSADVAPPAAGVDTGAGIPDAATHTYEGEEHHPPLSAAARRQQRINDEVTAEAAAALAELDEDRQCGRCGETAESLSEDNLCDGCQADLDAENTTPEPEDAPASG